MCGIELFSILRGKKEWKISDVGAKSLPSGAAVIINLIIGQANIFHICLNKPKLCWKNINK